MTDLKFTTAADYMADPTSFVIAPDNQLDEMVGDGIITKPHTFSMIQKQEELDE